MPDRDSIRRDVAVRLDELQRLLRPMMADADLFRVVLEVLHDRPTRSIGAPVEAPAGGRHPEPAAPSRPARGGPKRSDQALALIAAKPGITPAELAQRMGIHPQYVYRILPKLAKAGRVIKVGHGYLPARADAETPEGA